MRVVFIRHAIAQDRELWVGSDSSRPLTDVGKSKLIKISKALSSFIAVEKIFTSNYARAKESAEVLKEYFNAPVSIDDTIGIGAGYKDFFKIFKENSHLNSLMFVGHEPDFSDVISQIIGGESINLKVKKASFVEVEVDENFNGELQNLISPKTILALCNTH